MSHPWELTLRQLVVRVRREYGIELKLTNLRTGAALEKENLVQALPGMDVDDVIPLQLLEVVLENFRLPRLDFGLDAEDDE